MYIIGRIFVYYYTFFNKKGNLLHEIQTYQTQ